MSQAFASTACFRRAVRQLSSGKCCRRARFRWTIAVLSEGVLDFLRLLGQHVKRTTGAARHGLGSRSNVAGQPMGDRFVKVAQKGNGEDGLRVPVATDLNKGFMDICEHQRIVQRPCPGRASSKALVIFGRHSTGCSSDNAVSVALSTSEKSVCTSKRKAGNACSGRKQWRIGQSECFSEIVCLTGM